MNEQEIEGLESRRRDFREVLLTYSAGLLIAGVIGYAIYFQKMGEMHKARLLNQAAIKADTNKDGITTKDEWREVYRKLGIHYDELHPPVEISASDLERFVAGE